MQKRKQTQEKVKEETLQFLKEAEEKRAEVRFQRNLSEFLNDNLEILKNSEFTARLADFIYNQFPQSAATEVKSLLDKLFALANDRKYWEYVSSVLDNLCTLCSKRYNIGLMKHVCAQLVVVLDKKEPNLKITDNIYQFIIDSSCVFVRSNQMSDFDTLISRLWRVRNRTFNTERGKEEKRERR